MAKLNFYSSFHMILQKSFLYDYLMLKKHFWLCWKQLCCLKWPHCDISVLGSSHLGLHASKVKKKQINKS